jgi:glycosyltransferase involved in cell wall biosynthesis
MKILSVIEAFQQGGAENVLIDLVLGLREHEHRVVHFSRANRLEAHQPFLQALKLAGIRCDDVDWATLGEGGNRGRRDVLGDYRPDVILFHWWGGHPWQEWVWQEHRVPLKRRPAFICVVHHHGVQPPSGYDRYVAVASSQLTQLRPLPPDRVRLVPNGVALHRFRPRRHHPRFDTEMVVGRISSLRDGKIPADWVRTAADFRLPKSRFVIAGDGELEPLLKADVQKLGLDEKFSMPGYVRRPQVPQMLATFDVFCYVTSFLTECHPLALIEALAAGVPIVAERRGGITDIVEHGVNGFLADSSDQMSAYLHKMRRRPDLMARLAEGARRTAAKFSLQKQLNSYRDLLRDLELERDTGYRRGLGGRNCGWQAPA